MWQPRRRQLATIKAALFALCLVPFAHLVWGVAYKALGANPVEAVTHSTGWWTLFLICATLAVTPLRRATGANWLLKLRRMLGVFAFFYAALHFTTYVWLDQWFDLAAMAKDVLKRPYITVGFTAFLLLIPLAATSTDAMQRRLGRSWQRVHRFVYLIAVFGVLHFWWLVKRDVTEPAVFALALAGLLGVRLYWSLRRRAQVARPAIATSGG
jgi:methionine sulfoxide reductase heme-binding subunit